ncbi:MAG: hypothetical protein IPL06_15300 [Betaproteobacteria bacterium]|nr:hypothetical protein [Betaproteobacteria bacterium]
MNREDLEHIIRAAGEVTDWYEFVVVGSQSILGAVPAPPARLKASMEADIYPRGRPRTTRLGGPVEPGGHQLVGLCLDPTDLFLSKCHANREKDIEFNRELLRWNYVQVAVARERVADMPVTARDMELLLARISRLVRELRDMGIHIVGG